MRKEYFYVMVNWTANHKRQAGWRCYRRTAKFPAAKEAMLKYQSEAPHVPFITIAFAESKWQARSRAAASKPDYIGTA